jgi:tyrosyl-tRNA synthetase
LNKKFSDIDAAHKVGFNIKGLNSNANESAEIQNLKKELIETLASTTPLPKFVNTGADKLIDNVQRTIASRLQNKESKIEMNDYIETCSRTINKRITDLNSSINKHEILVLEVYKQKINEIESTLRKNKRPRHFL